jgi:ankyrin repeat protein
MTTVMKNVRGGVALACLLACPSFAWSADTDLRLLTAVREGSGVQTVRQLLRARVPVDAAEPDGTTSLHWAVRAGDLETAKLLLAAGAKATVANRYGVTPLSLAAANGDAKAVTMLLDAGADPNTTGADGETALMTAARAGKVDAAPRATGARRQRQRRRDLDGARPP